MGRDTVKPVTVSNGKNGSVTTHPAYAQISASRVTGDVNLYDSDFTHHHFMAITIKRSELHRNLNRDWHFDGQELIEVALSESQWATFISSPNHGGTPCTLEYFNGKHVERLPRPDATTEQFSAEIKEDLKDCVDAIEKTLQEIGELGLSKVKADKLSASLEKAKSFLTSGAPFIASQFNKQMERSVEKAKQEVHGYITNAALRAGIDYSTKESEQPSIEREV